MKRSDATVLSVSAVLAVIAVAAVAFSLLVLDRDNRPADTASSDSSLLVVTWATAGASEPDEAVEDVRRACLLLCADWA